MENVKYNIYTKSYDKIEGDSHKIVRGLVGMQPYDYVFDRTQLRLFSEIIGPVRTSVGDAVDPLRK